MEGWAMVLANLTQPGPDALFNVDFLVDSYTFDLCKTTLILRNIPFQVSGK
jgi:hypothetical protein